MPHHTGSHREAPGLVRKQREQGENMGKSFLWILQKEMGEAE